MWEEIRDKYFKVAGELKLQEGGQLCWSSSGQGANPPSVYVMTVSPGVNGEPESVIYVGMAGRGWPARARQNNGGLRRVHKGQEQKEVWKEHYRERSAWLSEGRKILVYEKPAETVTVFGLERFIQHAEESALIEKLNPLYNRAGLPTDS